MVTVTQASTRALVGNLGEDGILIPLQKFSENSLRIFPRPIQLKVTPLELTTKLMEAALAKGAELRIGTVSGVVSIAASESPGEGAGAAGSVKGNAVGDERRITGVSLDSGEEIPCDKVCRGD